MTSARSPAMEILNFQANGLQMEILGNGILYVHHFVNDFGKKNKWSAIPRCDLPRFCGPKNDAGSTPRRHAKRPSVIAVKMTSKRPSEGLNIAYVSICEIRKKGVLSGNIWSSYA